MMIDATKLAAFAWLFALTPTVAEPLDEHILAQLACQKAPDATFALIALERAGRIESTTATLMDSATCWLIGPSLDLAGISFSHICASAEDPLLIELFPDYYYRGPGTSPGISLALVTQASMTDATEWAAARVEGQRYRIEKSARVEGSVEISCNSLDLFQ